MLVGSNNRLLRFSNKLAGYSDSQPALTSYTGILQINQNGTYASGFNGIGQVWSRGGDGYVSDADFGGKHCADVRSKTLRADISGSDVSFNIINWFRQNSDFNGTANFNVLLTNSQPSYTFDNKILKNDILAFGDYSPIYMTWSATYPVGENVCVSAKILQSTQTMFVYEGENQFR